MRKNTNSVHTSGKKAVFLVWCGLFAHSFIHTCNIGHINYRLQFIYYNTAYNIWISTQYNK